MKKGYKFSKEYKDKKSELYKKYWLEGRIKSPTTLGKKLNISAGGRFRMSIVDRKSYWTLELRKRLSNAHKGKPKLKIRGSNHYNWKGGITPINYSIRNSLEYKFWREKVFARDNWTCVFCGSRSSSEYAVILNADHIKPFYQYPELRFDVSNGRTLCLPCHKKTDTYGVKSSLLELAK